MKFEKARLGVVTWAVPLMGTVLIIVLLVRFAFSLALGQRFVAPLIAALATLWNAVRGPLGPPQPYVPNFKNVPGVNYYDLANYQGHKNGWQTNDRILFCVPLRDAAEHLPMFFDHLNAMTYPHNLIDLSFLVSDSSDNTMGVLLSNLQLTQSQKDRSARFGNIEIYEKDFGQIIGQSFSDRHGFAAQGPRRKLMARARNWLGSVALKPYHSWVYWRDVDVETIPPTIMEDLMHHDKDVIVPNVWRPLPDWLGNIQPYDLNSWQESEGARELADQLPEDAVIVEGYPEYATWRPHLAYMRDPNGDPEEEMELDGIGGVSILSKANVFRSGSHFPAFSFEKHAETEAFGKLSRRMGYSVVGLPHYVIWHIYEPSSDDLKHMAWMAEEEKRKLQEDQLKEFYTKIWDLGFEDVRDEWSIERESILKNMDHPSGRKIEVDWTDDGEYDLVDQTAADKANGNGNGIQGKQAPNQNNPNQDQQLKNQKQQDGLDPRLGLENHIGDPQRAAHDAQQNREPQELPVEFDPSVN